ncbi:MAG TPA: Hpt domain-containing protein [Egibacteraceae bacterium]|nr:Hpt domain-containing protein [Egibacteraceae bacterium]
MTDPELGDMVARLWERMRPVVAERLHVMGRAAEPGADADVRAAAAEAAHKLAGSLGSYGYPGGSRLAARIEEALRADVPGQSVAGLVDALRREVGLG